MWQYSPYAIPFFLSALVSLGIAGAAWQRRRQTSPALALFVAMIGASIWAVCNVLEALSTDVSIAFFWTRFKYLGIHAVTIGWLIFVLQYTRRDKWLKRPLVLALLAVAAVVELVIWTNQWHGLFWPGSRMVDNGGYLVLVADHGPAFWAWITYAYILLVLSTVLLLQPLLRSPRLYRGQIIALLIATAAPWVSNLLFLGGVSLVDLSPLGFSITGVAVMWGLLRFRLLDLIPVARDGIIEIMQDAVLVVDAQKWVVDLNPAARQLLGIEDRGALGQPLDVVLSAFTGLKLPDDLTVETHLRFSVQSEDGDRFFDIHLSPLGDNANYFTGNLIMIHDVTELEQVTYDLQFQKDYLKNVIESMGDSLVAVGFDGRIKTVNQATLDLLGYREEELIGQPMEILFAEGTYRGTGIDTLKERGFVRQGDRTYRTKSGKLVPVSFSGEVMRDSTGRVMGIVCVAKDITTRKQMEAALRESEARYRSLAENATDTIFTLSPVGVVVSLNPAFERITGWQRSEWIGKDFINIIAPNQLPRALEAFQATLQGETPERFEVGILTQAGQEIVGEFAITPLLRDRRTVGILGIARDITERKRAEIELQKHFQQLAILQRVDTELTHTLNIDSVLAMALDIGTRLSAADTGSIYLLEGDRLHPVHAIGYQQTPPDIDCSSSTSIVAKAARLQQAERLIPTDLTPQQGSPPRAQIAIPLVSQENLIGVLHLETTKPQRFTQEIFDFIQIITVRIAVAVDNSNLYETTNHQLNELQLLYNQVSALEQLKTDMIRIAAHDLRNPLSVISLSTFMLSKEMENNLTPKGEGYLNHINSANAQMQRITSNILSLERIEKSAQGQYTQEINLKELIGDAFGAHTVLAAAKALTFTSEIIDEPLKVLGDWFELHEAAVNFISNAIKYTPDRGTVAVRLYEQGGTAIFEVKDSGYGIPEEQQARLFQPFFRAETDETAAQEGTGLGLHLVKRIVERHNGVVYFESVYGKGSTFGFRLPIIPSPAKVS